jgi:hypothetical protein
MEMKIPYLLITDGVEQTRISDESGYYVRRLGPMPNGSWICCDDAWCWPDGLAHYVEAHGIRLPDQFVAHVAARDFHPASAPKAVIEPDDRFWRDWCQVNAPFAYDPHCLACTSPHPPCG